jgi:hypothetical protein
MGQKDYSWVEDLLNARVLRSELVQELWSGYGELVRLYFHNGTSLILKDIAFPNNVDHPRGWTTNRSDLRKRKSYQVELAWYQNQSKQLDNHTKIPKLLGVQNGETVAFVLEDLNALGYDLRFDSLDLDRVKLCLRWLARFHGTFLGVVPIDLWQIGTYWHLDTRPDEYEIMKDGWLKDHARSIDEKLNNARFKTIVHGDAKVANFCFSEKDVAAVDFQYVGGGCGMKDVAYFISSCLAAEEATQYEAELLDTYFEELASHASTSEFEALEEEWRELYPFAWADFVRFLLGWAPDHYKLNEYSLLQVAKVKDLYQL